MESLPGLVRLHASLSACLARKECAGIEPDVAELAFLANHRLYRKKFEKLSALPSAERREAWQSIYEYVNEDFAFYTTGSTPAVRREDEHTLILRLNAGVFGPDQSELARVIETTWRSEKLHVRVEWVSPEISAKATDTFRFFLAPELNARPYTADADLSVHLSLLTYAGTLAHEIGHALGLPDRYFTRWRPETCDWTIDHLDTDIMSTSGTGHPLPQEFAELDAAYPLNGRASGPPPVRDEPVAKPRAHAPARQTRHE